MVKGEMAHGEAISYQFSASRFQLSVISTGGYGFILSGFTASGFTVNGLLRYARNDIFVAVSLTQGVIY
jgi:hypothetical protein